ICVANFAVWAGRAKWAVILAAGSSNKLTYAALGVGSGIGRLRSEALVIVVVAADYNIGVGIVERLPEWLGFQVVAVGATGTEQRLVKIGQLAGGGMRRQVSAKPFFLLRAGVAAANFLTFAVENGDMPSAELVAVVARGRIACSRAEVGKIIR